MESYLTIGQEGFAEQKIFESRFMAFAYPIRNTEDFKERIAQLKKLHPKANHHCYGYRLGLDGNNSRSSDAGEPSGTAGRPILGQIDSKNLTDTLIVVVRYFGGVLLGIPRLTNAYKTAASLVLQCTPIVQKSILKTFGIDCHYPDLHSVLKILRAGNSVILHQEMQLFCHVKVDIPIQQSEIILNNLQQIPGVIAREV